MFWRETAQIHEFWTFGNDRITPKVHPFACVDVSTFVGDCFATDYLTENRRRVPMFGRKCIIGGFEWIGIHDFLMIDGPPWTVNILAPYSDWGSVGPITSQNLSSGSEGYSDIVHIK